MDIKQQAQQLITSIESDKRELSIRAEGMIAGILLLLQQLEALEAQKSTDIPTTED